MTGPRRLAASCCLLLAAGCAGTLSPLAPGSSQPATRGTVAKTGTPIQHVVILIQENRSFDNLFATFPGADGATQGRLHDGTVVPLVKQNLLEHIDVPHGYVPYRTDYDGGKMDGFDKVATEFGFFRQAPYQYVDPKQIAVYWTLARRYVLADHMFMTSGSDSFIAHQDLIAGGTNINAGEAIVDGASSSEPGCDAAAGTVTSLVTRSGAFLQNAGPFPCFGYATLRDLLDRKHVSWRYYSTTPINPWNAFVAIRAVRDGSQWRTNISTPQTKIFHDIAAGKLPNVSWVIPTADFSDHPGMPRDYGPDWIGSVVNAIGTSADWRSTLIVVLWDDWGGFYDHVPPRQMGFDELGFRVPAIIVSPYARAGYVAHKQYEFGSILRFIEDNWGLGRLGTSDVRAASIGSALNFSQAPRPYVPVRVAHPAGFFLSLPPSSLPLDTQ